MLKTSLTHDIILLPKKYSHKNNFNVETPAG